MRHSIGMLAAIGGLTLAIAGCRDFAGSSEGSGDASLSATKSIDSGSSDETTVTSPAASGQAQVVILKYGPLLNGRLATELVRQTVLATARDDVGLTVCDGSLMDELPEGATNVIPCEMEFLRTVRTEKVYAPAQLRLICLKREDLRKPVPQLEIEFPEEAEPASVLDGGYGPDAKPTSMNPGQKPADLEAVAIVASEWQDEVEPFLTKITGKTSPARSGEPAGDDELESDIELRLREMSIVSQFEAIRTAHGLPPGPTKDRLLAMGYANLGLLTQHHINHRWKVFAARGIVYGLRYSKAEPGPHAEEILAYTTALAGLHGAALKHIAAAGEERSARLNVIDAYCRMNTGTLLELVQQPGEYGELAAVLACLTLENLYSEADQAAVYAAAVESNPDCYRIYDCAFFSGLIGLHHDALARGPSQLAQSLPRRLALVADLPADVKGVLDDDGLLPATISDRLEAVPDRADAPAVLPWRVLGEIIRDEALVQSLHRMQFLTYILGVPTSDEYEIVRAMVGDHPLAPVLEAYSDRPDVEQVRAAMSQLASADLSDVKQNNWNPACDFGPRHQEIVLTINGIAPFDSRKFLLAKMRESFDWVTEDLLDHSFRNRAIEGMTFQNAQRFTAMELISPHHPAGIKAKINWTGRTDEERVAYAKEYADRPEILTFLANVMLAFDQYDDAVRVATRVTETAPSYEAYRVLAEAQLAAGNEDEYVAAAEESFKQPNFGLKATQFQAELAYFYMARGDFASALPHAEAAAESWSGWGMTCAIDCYTGLQEWDQAEQWLVQKIQRYPAHAGEWYAWCRWTGHGHEEQAKEFADAMIEPLRGTPPEEMAVPQIIMLSYSCLVAEDYLQAGDLRAYLAEQEQNPAGALVAAVCYMKAGRTEQGLAMLEKGRTWTTASPKAPGAARRAGIFLDAFTGTRPITPDVIRQLDADVETFDQIERLAFRAYYGELLVHLGHRDEGLAMLERSASTRMTHGTILQERCAQAFAANSLREHRAEDATRQSREENDRTGLQPVEAPRPQPQV